MHCLLVLFFVLLLSSFGSAQEPDKKTRAKILANVADDQRRMALCEASVREEQIKKFGKPLPAVSGHCWDGCPTSAPKPSYPATARRDRISGNVTINAVVDETGKVVYAKVVKGSAEFRRPALDAAYASSYQPKIFCGRPVKFWWRITYHFRPDQ